MKRYLILILFTSNILAQQTTFNYEVDLTNKNDAFNVKLTVHSLSSKDDIYSFVSYAPGVHQPLDFGRFVKSFRVYDKEGNELITNKISINDFRIIEPEKVHQIIYEIDDSFDMSTTYHPIYPMSGTGITDNYTIINPHGVFGYFKNLKNEPIKLKLLLDDDLQIGTALNIDDEGNYDVESFYHLTDSPILIGKSLSYSSTMVDKIKVEVYVYSPSGGITADMVLDQASEILDAAKQFIGYSPVERYTFLMYFASHEDMGKMPVFQSTGALEHSLSSTYALPDMPQYLPYLKNIIAHEYMHILSPLHLHSNVLANFDYSKPLSEDKHVWLYEGVTEWVSYYMQVYAGNQSPQNYLNYLSEKVTNSENYSSEYSLIRISSDWSTDEGNKQYGNIYQLGPLTAAMLDFKLLELSNGEKGLRNVYLDLIKKYGKDNPFDNELFFDNLLAITYPEISDFIERHIKKNTPFDFENDLAPFGIKYYKKKLNEEGKPTIGLNIRPNKNNQPTVFSTSEDYKGTKVQVGDIITHINGTELSEDTYHSLMESFSNMKIGGTYQLDIIRNGENLKITEELYPKYDYHVFEFDDNASKDVITLRKKAIPNLGI
ncbi:M61 family metallopeptidase [Marinigracilibium pacificum]|uniref:PDZ domain-containing protein n=1 Tax=Marinigracilibium pacificum TaxID=2729599 RepID=A0A848ITT9_9BACT|nr:PDZ domain-containing protein [Marinigracilibium pacificum]NMM47757.1 PDZ domain-containing protein [Marinigracilibium pacificum]